MKPALVVLLGLLFPMATAQNIKTESIYTSMNAEDCTTLEQYTEGEFIRQLCSGVGKHRLEVTEGDLRMNVKVKHPDGHLSDLDLMGQVSYGFSFAGPKAEWRVQNGSPIALILRYSVSEDPADSSITTSYLVVSKITAKSACVVGIIKPQAHQNVLARKLADQAQRKPCLKPRS